MTARLFFSFALLFVFGLTAFAQQSPTQGETTCSFADGRQITLCYPEIPYDKKGASKRPALARRYQSNLPIHPVQPHDRPDQHPGRRLQCEYDSRQEGLLGFGDLARRQNRTKNTIRRRTSVASRCTLERYLTPPVL